MTTLSAWPWNAALILAVLVVLNMVAAWRAGVFLNWRRWLVLVAVLAIGCATLPPDEPNVCRDTKTGRFVSCAKRGEPVGATYYPDRGPHHFYCRDANGIEWQSNGECD